ncbi:hypothetical protein AB0K49_12625 [Streptomyces decoyicus]
MSPCRVKHAEELLPTATTTTGSTLETHLALEIARALFAARFTAPVPGQ